VVFGACGAFDELVDRLWCGVVWCGVVWCGVVWCGVVWCPSSATQKGAVGGDTGSRDTFSDQLLAGHDGQQHANGAALAPPPASAAATNPSALPTALPQWSTSPRNTMTAQAAPVSAPANAGVAIVTTNDVGTRADANTTESLAARAVFTTTTESLTTRAVFTTTTETTFAAAAPRPAQHPTPSATLHVEAASGAGATELGETMPPPAPPAAAHQRRSTDASAAAAPHLPVRSSAPTTSPPAPEQLPHPATQAAATGVDAGSGELAPTEAPPQGSVHDALLRHRPDIVKRLKERRRRNEERRKAGRSPVTSLRKSGMQRPTSARRRRALAPKPSHHGAGAGAGGSAAAKTQSSPAGPSGTIPCAARCGCVFCLVLYKCVLFCWSFAVCDSGVREWGCADLQSRLARGERAKVERSEMYARTRRLYQKLPEIRKAEQDERARAEWRRRQELLKQQDEVGATP